LLIAFGVIVFVMVGVLVVDLGVVDAIFHIGTQQALQGCINKIREVVTLKWSHIDLAMKVIGLAFTAIFGMLAFLKGLHFAEINLPKRLVEFLERIRNLELLDRGLILAPYATRNLRGDQTPTSRNRFDVILRKLRREVRERAIQKLVDSVEDLNRDIPVLAADLEKCKTQRISAHLVEALRLAAEANTKETGSAAQVEDNEAALAQMRSALELDGNDLDALELAAKLARRLNRVLPTQQFLNRLETAGREQKRSVRQSRTLRYQAEVLEERGTGAARREARAKLESAITVLDQPDAQSSAVEKLLELALVNEQLASLHITRGTPTLAETHLSRAETLYGQLHGTERSTGELRVERLRARLTPNAPVEEEPTETEEGAATTSNGPTHVNVDALQVYEAPKSPGAVIVTLSPFTALTVIKVTDKWGLIAKRGEPLGYVPMSKLRELN
jgi:hypothetical protein